MKMNAKENALRIIRFDKPERVVCIPPKHIIGYRGCNHEGYTEGGHHLPVGSKWVDIWGTMWEKEHEGVIGFPVGHPLADLPGALKDYEWPSANDERIWQLGRNGGYFCGPDQSMPYPDEHVEAVREAVEEFGCYPLEEFV